MTVAEQLLGKDRKLRNRWRCDVEVQLDLPPKKEVNVQLGLR